MRTMLALAALVFVAQPVAAETLEARHARLQAATRAEALPSYDIEAFCNAAERRTTALELSARSVYREWQRLPCARRERLAAEAVATRNAPQEDAAQCDRLTRFNAASAGHVGGSHLVLLACLDNLAHQRQVDAAMREYFRAHR